MEIVYALAIGVLSASGVWLLLRQRTFQVLDIARTANRSARKHLYEIGTR